MNEAVGVGTISFFSAAKSRQSKVAGLEFKLSYGPIIWSVYKPHDKISFISLFDDDFSDFPVYSEHVTTIILHECFHHVDQTGSPSFLIGRCINSVAETEHLPKQAQLIRLRVNANRGLLHQHEPINATFPAANGPSGENEFMHIAQHQKAIIVLLAIRF